jgi:hypothetical protein
MRFKVILVLMISLMLISCFNPPETQTGTLSFQTTINEDLAKTTIADTALVEDLIWRFASFEISTERIVEGAPDTLHWIPVYSDTGETRLSEFSFETDLPAGTYRSIRLAMRNRNWWEVSWHDSLLIIEDWNRGEGYAPDETPYSYYDFQGCWYCDQADTFYNVAPDESIADIVIGTGDMVNVTMNWNLYKISFSQKADSDSLIATDWFIRDGHDMIEWQIEY